MEITDQNIDSIINSNKAVVIDFWAAWCAPCRMVAPIIDQLAQDNEDVIIGKLDITDNKESQIKYGVSSIPTIIYFRNGEEVNRTRGALPKSHIQKIIDYLKN